LSEFNVLAIENFAGWQDAEGGLAEATAISQQKAKDILDMQAALTSNKYASFHPTALSS